MKALIYLNMKTITLVIVSINLKVISLIKYALIPWKIYVIPLNTNDSLLKKRLIKVHKVIDPIIGLIPSIGLKSLEEYISEIVRNLEKGIEAIHDTLEAKIQKSFKIWIMIFTMVWLKK